MKGAHLTAVLATLSLGFSASSCALDGSTKTSLGTDKADSGGSSTGGKGGSILPNSNGAAAGEQRTMQKPTPDGPPNTGGASGTDQPSAGQGGQVGARVADGGASVGDAGASVGDGGAPGVPGVVNVVNASGFALDDSFFMAPCRELRDMYCVSKLGSCPAEGDTLEESFQLGGEPGKLYDVTLQVNGIVEVRYYEGGTRRHGEDVADIETAPGADTFYVGGAPVTNVYHVYQIGVFEPDGTTEIQHYFLNSVPFSSNLQRHTTTPISYQATIRVPGHGVVKYRQQEPDCQALNNCGEGENSADPLACGRARSIPTEPNLMLPASYLGEPLATFSIPTNGATTQPYHAQIIHVTVKKATEAP